MKNKKLGLNRTQKIIKRCFDLLISIFSIIILLPIYILIAIIIKIDSKGKVLYLQDRVGRNGNTFKIYKFRTMVKDAELKTGPVLESENDKRVTKVGKILRKTKLDEIPQFFNVLIGNMSIVGPRPERPFFADKIKKDLREFKLRETVKPGITGEACVSLGYYANPRDKLKYHLKYIECWSLKNDIIICLKTLLFLIKQK